MRILHVIADLDPAHGGPTNACLGMARAVAALGHDVEIHTTDAGTPDAPQGTQQDDRITIHRSRQHAPASMRTSFGLAKTLRQSAASADLMHIHSLYLYHDWAAPRIARAHGLPYIVRPHGSLDPFIWQRHRGRKRLVEVAFQNRALRDAAAIHYTTEEERQLAAPYAQSDRAIVVPNGIDPDAYAFAGGRQAIRDRYPVIGDRKVVLFFSRLHFKKGLDVLARTFADLAAQRDDIHLLIVGPDDGVQADIEGLLDAAGVSDRVTFTGLLLGDDKLAALHGADVFALPSHSENFGIAVVEAMACGVPVAISDKVNIWREVETAGAGLVAPVDPAAFSDNLAHLLDDGEAARQMGAAGQQLVRELYDWKSVGRALEAAYADIVAKTCAA